MRLTVVRLFWCSLSNLAFGCKQNVSIKGLELLILVVLKSVVVL